MDPIDQFKERYQQYAQKQSTQPVYVKPAGKSFFNKFYVQGLIVGIIIVASSVLIYMNFQPTKQTTTTPPKSTQAKATPAPKIQITEAQIDEELVRIWGTDYEKNKNDPKLREIAKENIIHKLVLTEGLTKNNIDLSSIASIENPGVQQYKTEDALAKKVVTSRTVDEVAAYVNPEAKNYDTNHQKALASISRIREDVIGGKTIDEAYKEEKASSGFYKDFRLIKNEWITKKSGLLKPFIDALFQLKTGDITAVLDSGGSIRLMKITEAVDSQYNSLDDWYKSQQ